MFNVPEGNYFIALFQQDYADEFDVYGITLLTRAQALYEQRVFNSLPEDFDEIELSFGTNEALVVESKEQLGSWFELKPLTKTEYDVIKKHVAPDDEFGHTWMPSAIREHFDLDEIESQPEDDPENIVYVYYSYENTKPNFEPLVLGLEQVDALISHSLEVLGKDSQFYLACTREDVIVSHPWDFFGELNLVTNTCTS